MFGARSSNLIASLQDSATRSKRYSERHFDLFGYIAVFVIPATTFIERLVVDPEFNTAYVRILAGVVGAMIVLRKHLPKVIRDNLEWAWVGVATFVLPVCFGLILTWNAALTDQASQLSPIWVYQYLVAVFIFVQLIHNVLLSSILWIVASFLVGLSTLLISEPNIEALRDAWLLPLPVYLTALIVGSLANRNVQMVESEKLRAASAIGSNIAHELRTPLASVGILSRAAQKYMPILVDGYQRSLEQSKKPPELGRNHIVELKQVFRTIEGEIDYSNTIINMLLENTSDSPVESRINDMFPASQAICEALKRYPFNNSSELRLIEAHLQNDFMVRAPYMLVVHVLFNLIKNGVNYSRSSPDGFIKIFCGLYNGKNSIVVSDNGRGISDAIKLKIFDRFFTTTEAGQGAGIGLSFCKMVMEGIGGEIVCDSREGEYTTFRLLFPPVS